MRTRTHILSAIVLLGVAIAPARANLTITPTYTSAIQTDPQSAAIEGTINSAISMYEATYTNPINVTITFDEFTSGLGESSSYTGTINYINYAASLHNDKPGSPLVTYVPIQFANPVNGSNKVTASVANLRLFGDHFTLPPGATDGTIYLNTSATQNDLASPVGAAQYDLSAVVEHEIDEVLGLGTALNGLANTDTPPTGAIQPEDLYRFSAPGVRSFTPSASAVSYFSVDNGNTNVVGFNQNIPPIYQGGDYSDWTPSNTPRVQDAFGAPGQRVPFGPAESLALQSIGYNVAAMSAPEPSPLASLAVGILGLGFLSFKARRHTA